MGKSDNSRPDNHLKGTPWSVTPWSGMSNAMRGADYGTLLTELKTRIHTAQYAALHAVNKELIALYLDIGKLIEERQEAEGWTKNTLILDRCRNPQQREFYLRATARFGWTRRVLVHQIDNQTYEKYLLNQTSFDSALPQAVAAQGYPTHRHCHLQSDLTSACGLPAPAAE